jgi:hypothetical protein
MSHSRTRYFLLGSAAVLVGGLAVGTAAYMGGVSTRAFASQAGPDDLALVPAGAAMVAYANVHDVMQSEFRQRLTAAMDSKSEGRVKFQEETGIDIERDIDSAVAAAIPNGSGSGHDFGFVALRGRFDTTRIEALVSSKGGRLDEYRGARLLLPPAKTDDAGADVAPDAADDTALEADTLRRRHEGPPAIALVDANLVIVGTLDAVKAAIDRHQDQSASILSDGEFVRMLENLESDSTMWAIGRSSVLMGDKSDLPEQVASKLPGVKWVAASGHVNGGLRATLQAEANDAEAGKNLRDIVQGALAIARLQVDGKPELAPLLQGLQVEGTGTSVAVRVAMPSELLDVILSQMHGHAARHLDGRDGASRAEE